jgi:hypothetical protein
LEDPEYISFLIIIKNYYIIYIEKEMAVPKRLHGSPPSPEKQIGVMTIPA